MIKPSPYIFPGIRSTVPAEERVFCAIQNVTGINRNQYAERTRRREIVYCRHVAHTLLKEKTSMSLEAIGIRVAGLDHTTVLNSIKNVQKEMAWFNKTGNKQELYDLYTKCRDEFDKL